MEIIGKDIEVNEQSGQRLHNKTFKNKGTKPATIIHSYNGILP